MRVLGVGVEVRNLEMRGGGFGSTIPGDVPEVARAAKARLDV